VTVRSGGGRDESQRNPSSANKQAAALNGESTRGLSTYSHFVLPSRGGLGCHGEARCGVTSSKGAIRRRHAEVGPDF
jgi:hypothetical protein